MTESVLALLEASRKKEWSQAQFYRWLAVLAQDAGDGALSERFNALLADEQHHLSRLTARILELGGGLPELGRGSNPPLELEGWEEKARGREDAEVAWYVGALTEDLDPQSNAMVREILDSEREHARELGGKWMPA